MLINDFVLNGMAHGPVGSMIDNVRSRDGSRFEPGLLRPYFDANGVPVMSVINGVTYDSKKDKWVTNREVVRIRDLQNSGIYTPVMNATSLRKEEWIRLDQVVLRAARYRLRAWADLAAANSYGGFNGMAKTILEHETMTDPGIAVQDMDGLTDARTDTPQFQLQGLPLPITHSDFWFGSRRLSESRATGTPLDTTMAEAAARRVAELIEKTLIGNVTGITYGGVNALSYGRTSQVYGYTNFPPRLTKTNLTAPTQGGWTPAKTLADVLAMRDQLTANKFYGPFIVYHSNDWDQYMDSDYILTGGNVATQTLRERILTVGKEGGGQSQIVACKRLDFLFATPPTTNTASASYTGPGGEGIPSQGNPFTLIMVQMTADVARAVNGMDITTVQWETKGGMQLNFKVLCIQVPQLRADFYNNCGILHATTS